MAGLSTEQKANECISFSLKLRAAWSLCNYHRFFKLYRVAPKMAGYLVDWFADRERKQALRAMLKGFVFSGNMLAVLMPWTQKQQLYSFHSLCLNCCVFMLHCQSLIKFSAEIFHIYAQINIYAAVAKL